MLKRILRWIQPRSRMDLSHWIVTVYTRENCSCCETAIEQIKPYQRRYRFAIDEIDVDSNPLLAERYGSMVPVVAIQGRVKFKGKINTVLFERILRSEGIRF